MSSSKQEIGFLTMAFGRPKYIKQAEDLARSLRANMPGYRIALITDQEAYSNELFDQVIPLKADHGKGVVQKLFLYDYSPFEETLFIDADSICLKPFDDELDAIRKYGFSPIWSGFRHPGQKDPYLEDLSFTLSQVGIKRMPKFNGGVYYFDRGPFAQSVVEKAHQIYQDRAALKIRNFDSAGPNDETIYGLALESTGRQAYHAWGKFMKTPLSAITRVKVDPKRQICEFSNKYAHQTPAILHFAGPSVRSLEYKFCIWYFNKKPGTTVYNTVLGLLTLWQYLTFYPISKINSIGFAIYENTRGKNQSSQA